MQISRKVMRHVFSLRRLALQVRRIHLTGTAVVAAACGVLSVVAASGLIAAEFPPHQVATWNTSDPYAVAVDRHFYVYVVDQGGRVIRKFSPAGVEIAHWNGSITYGTIIFPTGLATDANYIYVADRVRVQRFNPDGADVRECFTPEWFSGQTQALEGVGVDASGDVYVADAGVPRILKGPCTFTNVNVTNHFVVFGSAQFKHPTGVAVDASGNVYVADRGEPPAVPPLITKISSNGAVVNRWGAYGDRISQFISPNGVAVDSSGNVYVSDTGNNRIQKFTQDGVYLTQWGTPGNRDGQFQNPNGVAVDASGCVYVADTGNARIQKFAPLSYGDSNGDGTAATMADLNTVVDHILGRTTHVPGDPFLVISDLNLDGSVTMQDLNIMVDCLLGRPSTPSIPVVPPPPVGPYRSHACSQQSLGAPANVNQKAQATFPSYSFAGNTLTINATFFNNSPTIIAAPYLRVASIGGPGCPCWWNSVPLAPGVAIKINSPGAWAPNTAFTTSFQIQLTLRAPITFYVDVMGNPLN